MSGPFMLGLKPLKPDPFKLAGFRDAAEIEAEKNPPKPPEVVLLSREELIAIQAEAVTEALQIAEQWGSPTLEELCRNGVTSGILAYHEALSKKAAAR